MTDNPNSLPPLRLRPENDDMEDIRRRAIERQSGEGGKAAAEERSRPVYPSDLDRRARTVTITLPEVEQMEFIRESAERLSKERNEDISPTRLATLILAAGLELWKSGELVLATESEEVEKLTVKPAEGD